MCYSTVIANVNGIIFFFLACRGTSTSIIVQPKRHLHFWSKLDVCNNIFFFPIRNLEVVSRVSLFQMHSVFIVQRQIQTCVCMGSTKIRSKIIPSGLLSGFELHNKEHPLKMSQSDSDLTLCIPRQSSKAVSWCRLNSVEFNSRWIPKRSLCRTRDTRGQVDAQPSTAFV